MFKLIFWVCILTLIFAAFMNFLPYILVAIAAIAIYYVGYEVVNHVKHRK